MGCNSPTSQEEPHGERLIESRFGSTPKAVSRREKFTGPFFSLAPCPVFSSIPRMKVVPVSLKTANEIVLLEHRHNKPVAGHKWSIGAEHDGKLVAVCIVGRPIARMLDDGMTIEVLRLCAIPDGPPNVCSFLYRAAWRVWAAMGGTRLITFTLQSESGSSLRGAGFKLAKSFEGASWSRDARPRETQAVQMLAKHRWEIAA